MTLRLGQNFSVFPEMIIAVQGCCHGELDTIYDTVKKSRAAVDLLIICGDFQAIRNHHDLDQMAVPKKYQKMGNFYQYYNGSKIAPVPTIFIGGNHEASNYLHELFYGGWVCPNIYYLGCVGMINFMGLRIGGLSGIYKSFHYERGYYEKMPLTGDDIRSIYHVRKFTFMKAQLVREPVDIYMSHDWPRGIVGHGDKMKLLERKGFLKREIEDNSLGSPPASDLLYKLKPQFFFSAHMHCKFQATVIHSPITTPNNTYGRQNEQQGNEMVNPEEIEICDTSDDEIEGLAPPEKKLKNNDSPEPIITSFLALDKCGSKRECLELIKLDAPNECDNLIRLDREWLAITKTMSVFEPFCYTPKPVPSTDNILK